MMYTWLLGKSDIYFALSHIWERTEKWAQWSVSLPSLSMAVCKHRFFFLILSSSYNSWSSRRYSREMLISQLLRLLDQGRRDHQSLGLEVRYGNNVCPFIYHVKKAGLKEAENADNLLYLAHYCCQTLVKALLCLFYKILIFACS